MAYETMRTCRFRNIVLREFHIALGLTRRTVSLRIRLMLVVAAVFLTIFVIAAIWVINDARDAVEEELTASIEIASQIVHLLAAEEYRQPGLGDLPHRETTNTRHLRIELTASDQTGATIERPANETPEVPNWFRRLVEPNVRTISIPRALNASSSQHVLLTTEPADELAETWSEAKRLFLILASFTLGGGFVMMVILNRALRPLSDLTAAVEQVEHGDFSARVERSSNSELNRVVTRFNRMAEVLQTTRLRNEELAARSIDIQEGERSNLARELHDEMGQSLSAIRAMAVSIADDVATPERSKSAETAERATQIAEIASDVYTSVRNMMQRLRPAVLDELGFVRALETMVDDWNSRHADSFCSLTVDPELPAIPERFAIHLYRIVQEALTNVVKHTDGADVVVLLEQRGNQRVRLSIHDDGKGFDPENIPAGLGLVGIRERAELIGADLKLDPGPKKGVTIELLVTIG